MMRFAMCSRAHSCGKARPQSLMSGRCKTLFSASRIMVTHLQEAIRLAAVHKKGTGLHVPERGRWGIGKPCGLLPSCRAAKSDVLARVRAKN